MKQTAIAAKSKQLFLKKNIVARFNNLTPKNINNNSVTNDTFPTTITTIFKTALF